MYGKLIDNDLIYAPSTLIIDGLVHYHPSAELYAENGYFEVIDTPYPISEDEEAEVKYYVSSYEVQENKIVKVWTETEPPEPIVEIPQPDRLSILEQKNEELKDKLNLVMAALDDIIMGGAEEW